MPHFSFKNIYKIVARLPVKLSQAFCFVFHFCWQFLLKQVFFLPLILYFLTFFLLYSCGSSLLFKMLSHSPPPTPLFLSVSPLSCAPFLLSVYHFLSLFLFLSLIYIGLFMPNKRHSNMIIYIGHTQQTQETLWSQCR